MGFIYDSGLPQVVLHSYKLHTQTSRQHNQTLLVPNYSVTLDNLEKVNNRKTIILRNGLPKCPHHQDGIDHLHTTTMYVYINHYVHVNYVKKDINDNDYSVSSVHKLATQVLNNAQFISTNTELEKLKST